MKKTFLISSLFLFLFFALTNCVQEPCMGCGVQIPDVLRFTLVGEISFANQAEAQRNITLAIKENTQNTSIPLIVDKILLKSQKDSAYVFKVVNTYSMIDGKMPLQIPYSLSYKGKNIGILAVKYAANRKTVEKAYFNDKELTSLEQCNYIIPLTSKDLQD